MASLSEATNTKQNTPINTIPSVNSNQSKSLLHSTKLVSNSFQQPKLLQNITKIKRISTKHHDDNDINNEIDQINMSRKRSASNALLPTSNNSDLSPSNNCNLI